MPTSSSTIKVKLSRTLLKLNFQLLNYSSHKKEKKPKACKDTSKSFTIANYIKIVIIFDRVSSQILEKM